MSGGGTDIGAAHGGRTVTDRPTTYLDHNAGTPLLPEAHAAITGVLGLVGNPSSVHGHGRTVRRHIDDARAQVGRLAGVAPDRIVFTGGGTEAANLGLRVPGRRVIVSAVEHDCVRAAASVCPLGVATVPVDSRGVVDVGALDTLLSADPRPALVAVMAVNNETGVVQPMAGVRDVAARHGALVLSDAVQAAGHMPLPGLADMILLSGHKIGAPPGIGALVLGPGLSPEPLVRGGGQEMNRRAGTENLLGIVGFGAAAAVSLMRLDAHHPGAALRALRDRLERRALDAVPEAIVFGADAPRVPTTTCIAVPGFAAETLVMGLDLAGVSVSAGSACSSGRVRTSHVLAAMGVPAELARCAIRVSLGWTTTADDVDRFFDAWTAIVTRRRVRAA